MLTAAAAGASLVLLIAGANVAILLLVRGRRRQRDLSIRLALGASTTRLVRLLVFEGVILGVAATAIGLGLGRLAMDALAPLVEEFLDRRVPGGVEALTFDGTVLVLTALCGLGVTLLFTVVPLLAVRLPRLSLSFAGARGATDSRAARRTRSVLISVEVAASLTLLVGSVLMLESARRMLHVDFGIDADRVVTAGLGLRQQSYPDEPTRVAYFERLKARLGGVAGSASVALGNWSPLQTVQPRAIRTTGAAPIETDAGTFAVSSGYFETLGIPILDGRGFTPGDNISTEPVVVVSAALARQLWPGGRGVGQQIVCPSERGPGDVRRVVGVAGDVRQSHADTNQRDAYLPLLQEADRFAFVYLRQPRSPAWESELRGAVANVDREVAISAARRLDTGLEQERRRPRFLAGLLTMFAVSACGMALVGLYGVIAYGVRQRQREIAIRMAIGADRGAVTRLFLVQGAVVLGVGLAAGLWGAVHLGRVLESYLHGVTPADPRLLALALAGFALTGLVATWWPARRAAAINAAIVLKDE